MNIRAVLFDLDGTLVDSLEDLTDAVNHMRATFSLPQLDAGDVRMMVGKGARNLIHQALPNRSEADIESGLERFVNFNTAHIADKSRLYQNVPETLEQLQVNGIRLAVISNKNEHLSSLILRQLNIHHFFEIICGGDTFPQMKPSPLPLLQVLTQFGAAPQESLMIGDSINDFQAGKNAGIATIGCNWGYGTPAELKMSDYPADSFKDILAIITHLGIGTA